MKDDSATIRRAAIERWLATAAFNAYFRFRVGALGEGTCTLEVPFHEEFLRPGDVVSGPVFMAAADAATWLAMRASVRYVASVPRTARPMAAASCNDTFTIAEPSPASRGGTSDMAMVRSGKNEVPAPRPRRPYEQNRHGQ